MRRSVHLTVVSLNNYAINLQVRGSHAEACETFKDALDLLVAFGRYAGTALLSCPGSTSQPDANPLSSKASASESDESVISDIISLKLKEATERLAKSFGVGEPRMENAGTGRRGGVACRILADDMNPGEVVKCLDTSFLDVSPSNADGEAPDRARGETPTPPPPRTGRAANRGDPDREDPFPCIHFMRMELYDTDNVDQRDLDLDSSILLLNYGLAFLAVAASGGGGGGVVAPATARAAHHQKASNLLRMSEQVLVARALRCGVIDPHADAGRAPGAGPNREKFLCASLVTTYSLLLALLATDHRDKFRQCVEHMDALKRTVLRSERLPSKKAASAA